MSIKNVMNPAAICFSVLIMTTTKQLMKERYERKTICNCRLNETLP